MMVSGPIALDNHWERLCCTVPVRDSHCEFGLLVGVALLHKLACGDSSCESSVIAEGHEQTGTLRLQDQKLASLHRSAQAPRRADDLVRSCDDGGGHAYRQTCPTAGLS